MDLIITGSIAYDYLMRFPGRFTDHLISEQLHQVSLSFLVDDMTKHWGGTAANIAYNAALLGLRPRLMGTAGRDFPDYRRWLESVGVDTSTVRQVDDLFTASFFVNTDLDNNQIASFYTGAMALARNYSLADVYDRHPDMVVISPNDPTAMLNLAHECRERGIRFMYDPSQQVARLDGENLRESMRGAEVMVVNAYEAEIICHKTGYSLDTLRDSFELLVITQGENGADLYQHGSCISIPAFPVKEIKDPTGAGDAFRGGLLLGIAYNWPLNIAGSLGALCAAYALEHVGTQNHQFTLDEFVMRFRMHSDDNGLLEMLLNTSDSVA